MLHGFDVSAYQTNIVPTADFVIVKATEGSSYTSSRFDAQWASAKTQAKVRGAYHFARPEASSGSSQADRLLVRARAVPGELLVLDLEASELNQPLTNAWAREFGDRLRARAPGVTTVVYMGSSYASNGTGRGLADHFDFWWYPQYPSSAATTKWPSSVSPWLPGGLTCGWKTPHIWQFSSAFSGKYDANITALTLARLAGGTTPPAPAPQPKPWPGRYLVYTNRLMHGADVTWVQERLNAHGAKPNVEADGEYGKLTAAAVRKFQTLKRIGIDGIVGKETWTVLGKS